MKLEQICIELGIDALNVYRYAGQHLILIDSHGLAGSSIGYRIPLSQGIVGRVARTKAPFSVRNPHQHPDFHYVAGSGEEKYASFLGIPLMDFDDLLGVLVAQTIVKKNYRPSEIEALYYIGKKVAAHLQETV